MPVLSEGSLEPLVVVRIPSGPTPAFSDGLCNQTTRGESSYEFGI